MNYTFRHAICNEAFEKAHFADACRTIRKTGYQGIEIAPFTLAEDPATIPPANRREYQNIIEYEGLRFVGLHWLMVSPKGLHVTTPDAALRAPGRAMVVITHYQRLLNYIIPDFVHVLSNGRIVKSGTKELALELEAKGYAGFAKEAA